MTPEERQTAFDAISAMTPATRLAIEALIDDAHKKKHRWDWVGCLFFGAGLGAVLVAVS